MAWTSQKPNGKWLSRWRDANGNTRSKQFDTEDEARAHAEQHESSALARTVAAGPDFDDMQRGVRLVGKKWVWPDGTPWASSGFPKATDPAFEFATYIRAMVSRDKELRASTRDLYDRNIRIHVEDTPLGKADIRTITPKMLEDYWATLTVGTGALRNVHQLLSKGFNRAVLKGDIDVNPLKRAPDVKRPKAGRREEVVPLRVDDMEKLADGAKSARDRLEILVMGYGGLRAGEVGGLREQDIEFVFDKKAECTRAVLALAQQVVRVTGRGQYIEKLKTKAARRAVTLPCSVSAELKAFIETNPPADDGRIFHGENGAMRAHNAVNHGVQVAAKAAHVEAHAHQLRHTAVSLLIGSGANAKSVQAFVGHSNIGMTMDTYGHLFGGESQKLADMMEELREEHRNGGVKETAS